jgi:mRNA-degrading endonuclease RelE of RelBE toxin-antitoxin system
MQSWKVKWADDATEQLAELWLEAVQRARVTIATDPMEQMLASDPEHPGKEASEGLWKLIVAPLVVLYAIDHPNRVVIVTAVGLLNE